MSAWAWTPEIFAAVGLTVAALAGALAAGLAVRRQYRDSDDRRRRHAHRVRIERVDIAAGPSANPDELSFACRITNHGEQPIADGAVLITVDGFCEATDVRADGARAITARTSPFVQLRTHVTVPLTGLLQIEPGTTADAAVTIRAPRGNGALLRAGVAFTDADGVTWRRYIDKRPRAR